MKSVPKGYKWVSTSKGKKLHKIADATRDIELTKTGKKRKPWTDAEKRKHGLIMASPLIAGVLAAAFSKNNDNKFNFETTQFWKYLGGGSALVFGSAFGLTRLSKWHQRRKTRRKQQLRRQKLRG